MLDPVIEAYYAQKDGAVAIAEGPSTTNYDGFGLSAYGRLALFTFELLKKEDTNVSLFLSFPETMTWIMGELLKVRQGCIDVFQTPSTENGTFYSPNLHADANAVVFRTLLRELSTMVTSWITLALEDGWESKVIHVLSGTSPAAAPRDEDDEDEDAGCSVVHFAQEALHDQSGFGERILADILNALAQSDASEVSPANAKGWCQLFKNASRMYF